MRSAAVLLTVLLSAAGLAPAAAQVADATSHDALRVCADPSAWPASGREQPGYENKIAELMAARLERPLEYTWFPMATGFVRKTLRDKRCDVIIGYAQGDELVQNTNAYYTSTHVMIVKAGGPLAAITSLDDPALKDKVVGVIAGTPPASHLARVGLLGKARPYQLFADRAVVNSADQMLDDLESGQIDVAILWGPQGGPMAKARDGLTVIPLLGDTPAPKLFYRITMGVRPGEDDWKRQLNSLIRRNQDDIDRILIEAGVPVTDDYGTALKAAP
ncbi:quinoprotein dehydrogenase-associated putative ABC transporter substrate-binding protein [Paracoccus sp. p4-l81]